MPSLETGLSLATQGSGVKGWSAAKCSCQPRLIKKAGKNIWKLHSSAMQKHRVCSPSNSIQPGNLGSGSASVKTTNQERYHLESVCSTFLRKGTLPIAHTAFSLSSSEHMGSYVVHSTSLLTVSLKQKVQPMAFPICRTKPVALYGYEIQCTVLPYLGLQPLSHADTGPHPAALPR